MIKLLFAIGMISTLFYSAGYAFEGRYGMCILFAALFMGYAVGFFPVRDKNQGE